MSLGHMCSDLPQGALAAVLPFLISTYGYDYATVSLLVMASCLTGSVSQPFFGFYADKHNQPYLIGFAVILAAGGIAAMGFIESFWLLCICTSCFSIGNAMFHPPAALMVNKLSDNENRGSNISIFSFGGQLGFAAGPVMATTAIAWMGMQGLWLLLIPSIIMCTLTMLSLKELYEIGARKVFSAANKVRTGNEGDHSIELPQDNWKGFIRLCFIVFGRSTVFYSINTFLALYWISVLGQSKELGTTMLSIFFAISTVLTLIGGKLADKYGFVRMTRLSYLLLCPALLLLGIYPNIYLAAALMLPMAAGLSISYSPMVVLGQLYLPNRSGFASGVTMGLSFSIGGIMAPLIGKIGDIFGLSIAFMVVSAITLIPITASFLLPPVAIDEGK